MSGSATIHRGDLPAALLLYSGALAFFLIVPPFLTPSVGPPSGFTWQETLDIVAPLVVMPLAWLAFDAAGGLGRAGNVLFIVVAVAWVEAHGIHLAANAIGDVFKAGAARDAFCATAAGDLDHWLDEILSHWIWHFAWVAISVLLIAAATRSRVSRHEPFSGTAATAGLLQGATFFIVTVEGSTAALGIPWSVALLAWAFVASSRGLARRPVATFFLVTAIVTLVGYVGWAALNEWTLPEFTKAGMPGLP